jgi:hypothetical protein
VVDVAWLDALPYREEQKKEVGGGLRESRWAAACWGFFVSFLFLIFSLLLLLLITIGFQEKESRERGQKFRRISNIFEIPILSQNNFQTFCKSFGLLALIKLIEDEKGLLRNHTR